MQSEFVTGYTLPRPNAYGISITTKDGVVCIGGGNAQEHFADVFLLRWENERILIETLPPLPKPNAFAAGAMLGDVIYVAGGIETPDATNTLKAFWALDLSSAAPAWHELNPWPGAGRMLAVAAPSPAPALGQSHFLVLGGDDGTRAGFEPIEQHPGFRGELLAYHTITDTWTSMGTAAVSRVAAPTVWWRDRIVIPSGEMRPGVRSPEVWAAQTVAKQSAFGTLDFTSARTAPRPAPGLPDFILVSTPPGG